MVESAKTLVPAKWHPSPTSHEIQIGDDEALKRSILDTGLRLPLCALATAPRRFTLIGNGALRAKNNVQRLEPKQLDLPVFEAFSPDFGGPEALTSLSINLLSLVIR